MSNFKEKLLQVQEQDKVIYYDYLSYKRGAGWWTGFANDDWHRPLEIKRARYNASFLQSLPNYYFLGFPIKELLKSSYSDSFCHACVVALSLCFCDFEVVTCNLKGYIDYYNEHTDSDKTKEFEHTILLIPLDSGEIIIDTTFGFITNFRTYQYIFQPNKIKVISSDKMEKTKVYQYIKSKKLSENPSLYNYYDGYDRNSDEYKSYLQDVYKYEKMCKYYLNLTNKHLQDFIRNSLYDTSNYYCVARWRDNFSFKQANFRYEYPTNNMFSLVDDISDFALYSTCRGAKERDAEVLDGYQRLEPQEIEQFLLQSSELDTQIKKLSKIMRR